MKSKIKNKANLYVIIFMLIAAFLCVYIKKEHNTFQWQLLYWIFISIAAESSMINLNEEVGISVGLATNIASIIVMGPFYAAVCSSLGICLRIVNVPNESCHHIFNTSIYKTVFNFSQIFMSTILSGYFYEIIGGKVHSVIWPQVILIIPVYIGLNNLFIMAAMYFFYDKKHFNEWKSTFSNVLKNSALVGFVGIIMALTAIRINLYSVLLFFVPLLIARFPYEQYRDMKDNCVETINAFSKALEVRDTYTSGHSFRVQKYTEKLAAAMGFSHDEIQNIGFAALLHDIGKIGIEDTILKKPGELNDSEIDEIKKHAEMGSDILNEVEFLKEASKIIRSHHERYDGKGYPDGLMGEQVPVESLILSIADAYDAMTTDRPYRKALTKDEALSEIRKNAGIQFSPEIAEKFCEVMEAE